VHALFGREPLKMQRDLSQRRLGPYRNGKMLRLLLRNVEQQNRMTSPGFQPLGCK
jgi:hypothetical protein